MTSLCPICWLFISGWLFGRSANPAAYYRMDAVTFFAQSALQECINLSSPDTVLLDAAIFHATNQARIQTGLPPFRFNLILQETAAAHAEAMINQNFYGHENPYSPAERTAQKRVELRGKAFRYTAENIGEYQTIDTPEVFYNHYNRKEGRYEYLHCETKHRLEPYSYEGYARLAVMNWMKSPHHRANILNTNFTSLGCAVRLSKRPYYMRRAPFGRLVQNFGGY